jgi:hypothetical protein
MKFIDTVSKIRIKRYSDYVCEYLDFEIHKSKRGLPYNTQYYLIGKDWEKCLRVQVYSWVRVNTKGDFSVLYFKPLLGYPTINEDALIKHIKETISK